MKTLIETKAALELAIEALKAMYPEWFMCEDIHGQQDLRALEAALKDVNKQILVKRGLELVIEGTYNAKDSARKRIDDLAGMDGMDEKVISDLRLKLDFAVSCNLYFDELDRKFLMDHDEYKLVKSLPESLRDEANEVRRLITSLFGK